MHTHTHNGPEHAPAPPHKHSPNRLKHGDSPAHALDVLLQPARPQCLVHIAAQRPPPRADQTTHAPANGPGAPCRILVLGRVTVLATALVTETSTPCPAFLIIPVDIMTVAVGLHGVFPRAPARLHGKPKSRVCSRTTHGDNAHCSGPALPYTSFTDGLAGARWLLPSTRREPVSPDQHAQHRQSSTRAPIGPHSAHRPSKHHLS